MHIQSKGRNITEQNRYICMMRSILTRIVAQTNIIYVKKLPG